MAKPIEFYSSRRNPVYILQPDTGQASADRPKLLLGEMLQTTMLGLGKQKNDVYRDQVLSIKNDTIEGIHVEGITEQHPNDICGSIGGVANSRENIRALNERFSTIVVSPAWNKLRLLHLTVTALTVVVRRSVLEDVFSELQRGMVNPHFDTLTLIPYTLGEISDRLKKAVVPYHIID